ncbi:MULTISPECIES: TetR/AcrR family transcriptional regulator C-terminal domain-containing protein [Sphingomonadales]|nr:MULTISPECIES: TetR/AcrR family transcriptional regulator C-terminal domain-containing protein [Sphingomonadaceae]MBB4046948.1 hypothetical protein [Sphingomonas zeae]NUU49053.1 hypothetical protein [Sphingomonas zeae]
MAADSEQPPGDHVGAPSDSASDRHRRCYLWCRSPVANDNEIAARNSSESFAAGDEEEVEREETSVRSSELSSLEWTVLKLALTDNLASILDESRLRRCLRILFGTRQANRLADPRLEALRRFVVLRHLRTPDDADEYDLIRRAGFEAAQIGEIARHVTPRATRRHGIFSRLSAARPSLYRKEHGMNGERTEDSPGGSGQQDDMLHTLSAKLDDSSETLNGIDPVLKRGGYSKQEILSAFGSIDDLLVTIAERKAALLSDPLVNCGQIIDVEFARRVLTNFGILAWKEYSTSIIALVRLMVAEGAHSPDLRKRVYEAGPSSVAFELCQFFAKAHRAGVLNVPQAGLAAEQLLGMLREPLYEALVLNPAAASACDGSGAVAASVDLILDGCKRRRAP